MIMRLNSRKTWWLPLAAAMVGLLAHTSIAFAITDALTEAQRLMRQGQPAAALEQVNAYILSKPRDPQGPFLKGVILLETGNQSEALAVFSKLNEDYPELPEPYNNLAVLYAQQKQYEKARVTLEMAIRADPSYVIARENLGDVYAKLAGEAYGQALQIDPASKLTQAKLNSLRDLTATTPVSAASKQSVAAPAPTDPSRPSSSAQTTGAATPVASKPTKQATAEAAAVAANEARPEPSPPQPTEAPATQSGSTTAAEAPLVLTEKPDRGVNAGAWDLVFSPYTLHYNPDEDHKPVVMLGLSKGLEGRWLAGGVIFSNSFGQPSIYVYGGQRYVSPFGFENWYLQWTAGLLYGYVGEYQDKVPLNYKGFSPGFVPSIGYRFNKYVYGELDFLGTAALMFTLVAPLPKDWP